MRGVERNFERLAVSSPNHSLVKMYSETFNRFRQPQSWKPKTPNPTHVNFPVWFGRVFGHQFRIKARAMEKRTREKFDKLIRSNALGLILSEYSPSPDEGGKRRNSEGIDSFLLLAITEHLREKNTKQKPYYPLAVKLLKRFRGSEGTCSATETKRAIARVEKLKKTYHEDWQSHLQMLSDHYRPPTTPGG